MTPMMTDILPIRERRDFKSTSERLLHDIKDIPYRCDIESVQVKFALEIFTFGADENHAIYRALLGRDRRRHCSV